MHKVITLKNLHLAKDKLKDLETKNFLAILTSKLKRYLKRLF